MPRSFLSFWIPVGLCLAAIAPAFAAPQTATEDPPVKADKKADDKPAREAEKPAEDKPTEVTEFIRVRKDEDGKPLALETAIVRYVSQKGEEGVTLDLIGAVHVADRAYYEHLNKRFEQYDAMLFELVAEKGTVVPKGGKKGGDMLPVEMMKNMLKLDSQLEHIDYTKKNFVHADLSFKDMKEAMAKRGEDGLTLTLGILRDVLKEANRMEKLQAENPTELPDITLGDLFFGTSGPKLKRFLAVQLAMQGTGAMGETLNTLLIEDRNQAALKVFQTEMANGKRKMALFYGAAHMPDFEKRLLADYGLKRDKVEWVTAWDLK
jgi:hypothetical protein